MSSKPISLPNVTLCTVGSEPYRVQNQNALDHSTKGIKFGAVKNIIADIPSVDDWSYFIFYRLGDYITTDFALLIHADGFVVHPESWRDEFLDYDYVGAPWPLPGDNYSYRDIKGDIIRVGNSVSLRSKRLLDLPFKTHLIWEPFHGFYNEDGAVCVNYRHHFIKAGMTYAPLDVAKYFSKEVTIPENESITSPFCFHKHAGTNNNYPNFEVWLRGFYTRGVG